MPTSQLEMLRPADLAPQLGVSRRRIYQLIAARRLPAVRDGKAIRIPRAAWVEWLTGRSESALNSVQNEAK